MASQINLVLRKKINGILYDLMVKTVTDQVYGADNKSLTKILEEMIERIVNLENSDASNVEYTDSEGNETTVESVLNELTYTEVTVSVSSPTPSIQEKGALLTDLVINWTINKDELIEQSINGIALDDLSQRSYTDYDTITEDKTYTVCVNDGKRIVSDSISFNFKNRVYYGVSTETNSVNVDSSFILTLSSSKFVDDKTSVETIIVNAGDGEYIIYAQPSAFEEPIFNISGMDTTFDLFATIDFTNASGYTESYNVYKSSQTGLGDTSMSVR